MHLQPISRLPQVGVTVFTQMSALAQQHDAVNLGQGFPDFDCDPHLVQAVTDAMHQGKNQYPPMAGVLPLRQAVASKIKALYRHEYRAEDEITITAGATQGILTAVLALVHPGDEVVVLEPCYDSYLPAIALAGGVAVRVPLTPGTFRPDFDRLAAALTPRTRLLILNTPHNPSGTVWTEAEMQTLAQILAPTRIWLLSDEVYEHMAYAPSRHVSASSIPELAARSVVVSSFGKTFHVTGWKVGYAAAPAALMHEFRKVHQFNVFTVNTPMQWGLAAYLTDARPYTELPDFYRRKRDYFRRGLEGSSLELLPCEGTYFQCARTRAVNDLGDADFCRWLTTEVGVAAIPLSAFYADGTDEHIVRFCFAKQESTLDQALERLRRL